jgi:hypothetical protein
MVEILLLHAVLLNSYSAIIQRLSEIIVLYCMLKYSIGFYIAVNDGYLLNIVGVGNQKYNCKISKIQHI